MSSATLLPRPMSNPPLSTKWIIIGASVIGGLNWVLRTALAEPVLIPLVESMGVNVGALVFVLIVQLGSFFCGGLGVAYVSPGNTIKEPAIAATLAVAVNSAHYVITTRDFSPIGIAIAVAMAYAFALGGAHLGERLQGDTTDKMRERGELGR